MESSATAKYVRVSPRKVEQLLGIVRKKTARQALDILAFTVKASSEPVSKVIKSALANMGKTADASRARIKEAAVGKGVYMKRFRAGPQGRGMPYTRKTCHIKIVLSDEGHKPAATGKKAKGSDN